MAAHHTTIANAFEHLTVDGVLLDRLGAFKHFDKLSRKSYAAKHDWRRELADTVMHLTLLGGSSIPAHTSGTTGPPKNVSIGRNDLVNSARLTGGTFGLKPGDRTLHCLPCAFIAGKMMLVRAFVLGLDLHVIDPRGSVLDNLKVDDRFKFTAMLPLQLHRALQEDRARVERQFDTILLGGGPVSQALIDDLQGLGTKVLLSYGSTETVTHVALRALNGPDRSDLFTAIGDCHFARDPRGCLVVYTPHLRTKQHVTNDLIDLADDTRFRWLGRYDNVILSGGKKIFPEQLEAKTAGVIPYPHYFSAFSDPVLGQAISLTLETERPQNEVLPLVMEKLMFILQQHELPRRVIAVRKIERTRSGKIRRPASAAT
ncbi:MAG: AMP-binding protein [Flavobacteriales bacterium]|nr:AMP-binding protein [Flavobacteriales bacterium]